MARQTKQAVQPLARSNNTPGSEDDVRDYPGECDSSKRVLLIEDHPVALALLSMWLTENGFRAHEFESSKPARQPS